MDKTLFGIRGMRPHMVLIGLLSSLTGAAIIVQALALAGAIARLFQGQPVTEVTPFLVWFACAYGSRHTLTWLTKRCAGRFAEQTSERMRLQLLRRLFALGPEYAARTGSGRIITLALDGVDRVRAYVELFVPRMMDMIWITAPLLVVVYVLDLISGLILTFTLPVLIAFFILLGLAAQKTADRKWRSYQALAHHFIDALRGLETLRFLGRSRKYVRQVARTSDRYRTETMRTLRVAFLSSFALDFFSTLSVAFVAVGLGLRLINGSLGLESALAVLLLAPEYFTPVRMLGSDYHASLDGKEALQQMQTIAADEAHLPVHDTTFAKSSESSESTDCIVSAPFLLDEDRGQTRNPVIELQQVEVIGDDGNVQLAAIDAVIGSDVRKLGIVGMSGAGKTTLLNVLGGFLAPAAGAVRVDGRELAGKAKQDWQSELAYIPQHPHLFSATLADNVRFYEPHLPDEVVMHALTAAGLGELVRQLPGGMHERIGEGGRPLSGGEAHRVALARAFASGRSVILLDEPTAHLDVETELELKETIMTMFRDRLVILATHRLHWMQEMDQVWVLASGRLTECGTHEQLLARSEEYAAFVRAGAEPVHVGGSTADWGDGT